MDTELWHPPNQPEDYYRGARSATSGCDRACGILIAQETFNAKLVEYPRTLWMRDLTACCWFQRVVVRLAGAVYCVLVVQHGNSTSRL